MQSRCQAAHNEHCARIGHPRQFARVHNTAFPTSRAIKSTQNTRADAQHMRHCRCDLPLALRHDTWRECLKINRAGRANVRRAGGLDRCRDALTTTLRGVMMKSLSSRLMFECTGRCSYYYLVRKWDLCCAYGTCTCAICQLQHAYMYMYRSSYYFMAWCYGANRSRANISTDVRAMMNDTGDAEARQAWTRGILYAVLGRCSCLEAVAPTSTTRR